MAESDLDEDEERIIKGALSFSEKKVEQIMTPRTEVYALPEDKIFDRELIGSIFERGHSRIPVYKTNRDDIAGILYVKDLIANNYKDKTVGELARKDVIYVDHDKPLDELLNAFKKHRHHLFVVINDFGGVSGIVTIEDVIEEIIGSEIVDEYDKYSDLQAVARQKMEKKGMKKA
jgi:metal transporter CNNM